MSVAFAALIFSHTTSTALKNIVSTYKFRNFTAIDTAAFLSEIILGFYSMNSSKYLLRNPDKYALSKKTLNVLDIFWHAFKLFKTLRLIYIYNRRDFANP